MQRINTDRRRAWERAVPPFPWLKTWAELVLKDALMEAAKAGKGWLVWTTGRQQAKRWHQAVVDKVEALEWVPSDDAGERGVLRGWQRRDDRGPRWEPGGTQADFNEAMESKDLKKYVGPEIAAQLQGKYQIVRGQDLTLGAEEHRAIYDVIFLNAARALAKPWKARVEDVQVAGAAASRGLPPDEPMTMHAIEVTAEMAASIPEQGLPIMEERPGNLPAGQDVQKLVAAAQARPVREGEDHAAIRTLRAQAIRQAVAAVFGAGGVGAGRPDEPPAAGGPPADRGRSRGDARRRVRGLAPVLRPEDYAPARVPEGVDLLGLSIVAEMVEQGHAQLVGRRLTGDAAARRRQLAMLVQPVRNPLFETFGLIAVKRLEDGSEEILDHRFVSSRQAGEVSPFVGVLDPTTGEIRVDNEQEFAGHQAWLKVLGATGYYALHNHPSGSPQPSKADYAVTALFAARLPGYQGHLVIDSRRFAEILGAVLSEAKSTAGARVAQLMVARAYEGGREIKVSLAGRSWLVDMPLATERALPEAAEPWHIPAVRHPWIGRMVRMREDIADLGKAAQQQASRQITFIHIDSNHGVRSIENVPVSLVDDADKADAYVTARRKATGAVVSYAYLDTADEARWPMGLRRDLVRQSIVDEVIVGGPFGGYRPSGHEPLYDRSPREAAALRGSIQLEEGRPGLGPEDETDEQAVREIGRFFYERIPNYEGWAAEMRAHLPAGYHHLLPEVFDHLVRAARPELVPEPPPPVYGDRGQRLAGNLNLDKYESAEDVLQAVEQVQRDHADEFRRQARGVVPDREVARLAHQLGVSEAALRGARPGQAFNAETILATRFVLAQAAEDLMVLRQASARPEATQEDMGRFVEGLDRYQAVAQALAGMTAEAGRALRQFRQKVGPGQAALEDWQRLTEALGGPEHVREVAGLIGRLGPEELGALTRFVATIRPPSWLPRPAQDAHDKFYEYWINARLSGFGTQVRNAVSNLLYAAEKSLIERSLAAGFDWLRVAALGGERERFLGEVLAEQRALPIALIEAYHAMGQAWDTEAPVFGRGQEPFIERKKAIPGRLGRVIRVPTRAMLASDEFFKAAAYRMALHAEAYRQAAREGLQGQERSDRAFALAHDDTQDALISAARREAHVRTFTDEPPEWIRTALRLRDQTIVLKYVVPFIRTPQRLFSAAYQRTPLYFIGLAMQEMRYRQELADARAALRAPGAQLPLDAAGGGDSGGSGPPPPDSPAGPAEPLDDDAMERLARSMTKTKPLRGGAAADAAAKIAAGTFLMTGALVTMVLFDLLTGKGPSDPAERKAKEATGWRPYSWRVPFFGYLSYRGYEPFTTILGTIVDIVEEARDRVKSKRQGWMARVFGSVAKVIEDKTFLQGLSALAGAFNDPGRFMQKYVQNQATSIVPVLMTPVTAMVDDTARKPESIEEAFRAKLPVVSLTVRPQRDLWGRPIRRSAGQRVARALGSDYAPEAEDRGAQELARLHMGIRPPGRTVRGIELKDAEYQRFQEMAGLASKNRIAGLTAEERARFEVLFQRPPVEIPPTIDRTDYLRAPDDLRIEKIERVVRFARAEARSRLLQGISWADKQARKKAGKEEKLHPEVLYRLREGLPREGDDPRDEVRED